MKQSPQIQVLTSEANIKGNLGFWDAFIALFFAVTIPTAQSCAWITCWDGPWPGCSRCQPASLVAGLEGGLVTTVPKGTGVQLPHFRLLLAFGGYCLWGIIVVWLQPEVIPYPRPRFHAIQYSRPGGLELRWIFKLVSDFLKCLSQKLIFFSLLISYKKTLQMVWIRIALERFRLKNYCLMPLWPSWNQQQTSSVF